MNRDPSLVQPESLNNNNNPWTTSTATTPQNEWAPQIDIFEQESPKFEWESDTVAKTCRVCVKKFGFLLRRHHCRKCGLVVCDKCSPWKVYLNSTDILQDPEGNLESSSVLATQPQRVCEKCYFNQEH